MASLPVAHGSPICPAVVPSAPVVVDSIPPVLAPPVLRQREWMSDTTGQLLKGGSKRTANWTRLAKKYSHPQGNIRGLNHRILKGTGKSGLTPLSPFLPHSPGSATKAHTHYYQQVRLRGFSAAELEKIEALAAQREERKDVTLTNPIHPIFALENWWTEDDYPAHLGPIPIRGDYDGYWLANNPVVWKILEPSLRLASLSLQNAHLYEWWDALFHGPRRKISPWRVPPEFQHQYLESFHPRNFHIRCTKEEIAKVQDQFLHNSTMIEWRFFSGWTNFFTNLPQLEEFPNNAVTMNNCYCDKIEVAVGIEQLQPLLRNDLTDSERLTTQYLVASTILHEFAHACWEINLRDTNQGRITEPYFRDERLAELGWSVETQLWSGCETVMVRGDIYRGGPGLPAMGLWKTNWFTIKHAAYNNGTTRPLAPAVQFNPNSLPFEPWENFEYWPIPTSWACDLFQADLWDIPVRTFGSAAISMGPCTLGTLKNHLADANIGSYARMMDPSNTALHLTPVNGGMPIDEQKLIWWENSRKMKVGAIHQALHDLNAWQGQWNPDLQRGYWRPMVDDAEDDITDYEVDRDEDDSNLTCPRWDEITQYLFRNRGPEELALDSMTSDLAEPNMYKYIIKRGGLSITPFEFREFLAFTNKERLLFRWIPFPGVGTITRIDAGWPPLPAKHVIKQGAPPEIFDMNTFNKVIDYPAFEKYLYVYLGESGDIDIECLRRFMNDEDEHLPDIAPEHMEKLIHELARRNSPHVTLGPAGVARLNLPITEHMRNTCPFQYQLDKLKWNEEWAREDRIKVAELAREATEGREGKDEVQKERTLEDIYAQLERDMEFELGSDDELDPAFFEGDVEGEDWP